MWYNTGEQRWFVTNGYAISFSFSPALLRFFMKKPSAPPDILSLLDPTGASDGLVVFELLEQSPQVFAALPEQVQVCVQWRLHLATKTGRVTRAEAIQRLAATSRWRRALPPVIADDLRERRARADHASSLKKRLLN